MKNGVFIYEDGVLQEMHESKNFFVFVKKDEGGRYYKFIKNDAAIARAFFDLLLHATEELKEELTAVFGDEFY